MFNNSITTDPKLYYALAYAFTMILLIAAIAFYTVLERKVLASIQRRRGPNVVGLWGLGQALADGLKLILKEPVFVSGASFYIFLFSPIVLLALSLTVWVFVPIPGTIVNASHNYSFLVIFLFSGLNSYAIILAGIASHSRYSLIGGVRAIAQVISYEIPLSISLLTFSCVDACFNLYNFSYSNELFLLIVFPSLVVFFISILAETNRTPFDLPEAEAELVAGYNLEYSSILFSLFFLAEYSNMLVASSVISLMMFSNYFYTSVICFCILFILVRAILPRYTFRQLISLSWKILLPVSLIVLALTVLLLHLLRSSSLQVGHENHILSSHLANHTFFFSKNPYIYEFIHSACSFNWNGYSSTILNYSSNSEIGAFVRQTLHNNSCVTGDNAPLRVSEALDGRLGSIVSEMINNPKRGLLVAFDISLSLVLVVFFVAFSFALLLVFLNWVFSKTASNSRKSSSYECGFEPLGSPISDFEPNFIGVSLAFLVYDVEILLSYPWAIGMWNHSVSSVIIFIYFILLLLLGYAYEAIDGSFDI